ncbi:DUF6042 family protein, partial [Streptomyces longisporoflavus]|uniref:DUF6042 family protein n=1 Tax=Streptomyces longisporoflavus TaxID=28044 RepID=UPI0027E58470
MPFSWRLRRGSSPTGQGWRKLVPPHQFWGLRGQEPADAERLEAHQRFRLVMDWDHFNETRIQLTF